MKATKTRLPMDVLDPFAPTARLVSTPAPLAPVPMVVSVPSAPPPPEEEVPSEALPESRGLRRIRRETPAAALGPRGYVAGGRRPAPDLGCEPPMRLTAYLRPDQVKRLRREVVERQTTGQRADLSALLREAVDALLPPSD